MKEIIDYIINGTDKPEIQVGYEEINEVIMAYILEKISKDSMLKEKSYFPELSLSRMIEVSIENESFRKVFFETMFGEKKYIVSFREILDLDCILPLVPNMLHYVMSNYPRLNIETVCTFLPITSCLYEPNLVTDSLVESKSLPLLCRFVEDYKKIYLNYYYNYFRENDRSFKDNGTLIYPLLKSLDEKEEEFFEAMAYKIFSKALNEANHIYVHYFYEINNFRHDRFEKKFDIDYKDYDLLKERKENKLKKFSLEKKVFNSLFSTRTFPSSRKIISKIISADSILLLRFFDSHGHFTYTDKITHGAICNNFNSLSIAAERGSINVAKYLLEKEKTYLDRITSEKKHIIVDQELLRKEITRLENLLKEPDLSAVEISKTKIEIHLLNKFLIDKEYHDIQTKLANTSLPQEETEDLKRQLFQINFSKDRNNFNPLYMQQENALLKSSRLPEHKLYKSIKPNDCPLLIAVRNNHIPLINLFFKHGLSVKDISVQLKIILLEKIKKNIDNSKVGIKIDFRVINLLLTKKDNYGLSLIESETIKSSDFLIEISNLLKGSYTLNFANFYNALYVKFFQFDTQPKITKIFEEIAKLDFSNIHSELDKLIDTEYKDYASYIKSYLLDLEVNFRSLMNFFVKDLKFKIINEDEFRLLCENLRKEGNNFYADQLLTPFINDALRLSIATDAEARVAQLSHGESSAGASAATSCTGLVYGVGIGGGAGVPCGGDFSTPVKILPIKANLQAMAKISTGVDALQEGHEAEAGSGSNQAESGLCHDSTPAKPRPMGPEAIKIGSFRSAFAKVASPPSPAVSSGGYSADGGVSAGAAGRRISVASMSEAMLTPKKPIPNLKKRQLTAEAEESDVHHMTDHGDHLLDRSAAREGQAAPRDEAGVLSGSAAGEDQGLPRDDERKRQRTHEGAER